MILQKESLEILRVGAIKKQLQGLSKCIGKPIAPGKFISGYFKTGLNLTSFKWGLLIGNKLFILVDICCHLHFCRRTLFPRVKA